MDVIERLSCFRGSSVDVIERLSMFQRVICGRYREVVHVSEGHMWTL